MATPITSLCGAGAIALSLCGAGSLSLGPLSFSSASSSASKIEKTVSSSSSITTVWSQCFSTAVSPIISCAKHSERLGRSGALRARASLHAIRDPAATHSQVTRSYNSKYYSHACTPVRRAATVAPVVRAVALPATTRAWGATADRTWSWTLKAAWCVVLYVWRAPERSPCAGDGAVWNGTGEPRGRGAHAHGRGTCGVSACRCETTRKKRPLSFSKRTHRTPHTRETSGEAPPPRAANTHVPHCARNTRTYKAHLLTHP